jgi:hypothetical protein
MSNSAAHPLPMHSANEPVVLDDLGATDKTDKTYQVSNDEFVREVLCDATVAVRPVLVLTTTRRPSIRGDRCQCASCNESFNSTYAFDHHREGQYGLDRRCLVSAEMIAKGMAKSAASFWVARKMPLERGGKRMLTVG